MFTKNPIVKVWERNIYCATEFTEVCYRLILKSQWIQCGYNKRDWKEILGQQFYLTMFAMHFCLYNEITKNVRSPFLENTVRRCNTLAHANSCKQSKHLCVITSNYSKRTTMRWSLMKGMRFSSIYFLNHFRSQWSLEYKEWGNDVYCHGMCVCFAYSWTHFVTYQTNKKEAYGNLKEVRSHQNMDIHSYGHVKRNIKILSKYL